MQSYDDLLRKPIRRGTGAAPRARRGAAGEATVPAAPAVIAVKRALRALGDMCVFACGEMWRAACGLWCRAEGEARLAAAHQSPPQHGPTRTMRFAALADLHDPRSRQNALATATQARNEWITAGRPKGRGSDNWDDIQWLIKGRFQFISATLRRARARAGHGAGRQDGSLD